MKDRRIQSSSVDNCYQRASFSRVSENRRMIENPPFSVVSNYGIIIIRKKMHESKDILHNPRKWRKRHVTQ